MKTLLKLTLLASTIAIFQRFCRYDSKISARSTRVRLTTRSFSLFFKKEVEARSNGEIKVNIYPQGQFGQDKQDDRYPRAGMLIWLWLALNNYKRSNA